MTTSAYLRLAVLASAVVLCPAVDAAVSTWTSDPHGPATIENNRFLNDVWWSGPTTGNNGASVNLNTNGTLKVALVFGGMSGLQLLDDGSGGGSTEPLKVKVSAGGGTSGTPVDYKLQLTGLRGNFQHANPIVGTLKMGAGGSVDFRRDLNYVTTFGNAFSTDLHLDLTPKAGGAWAVKSIEVGLDARTIKNLPAAPLQVPEPRSVVLMFVGIGLIAFILRRRRKAARKPAPREPYRSA